MYLVTGAGVGQHQQQQQQQQQHGGAGMAPPPAYDQAVANSKVYDENTQEPPDYRTHRTQQSLPQPPSIGKLF